MREMTLKEIQQVSLEILKDVHEFCVANNIRYTLYGGTMIGAIRHKGFIPWDDDVDIAMLREDYERFCRSYKSQQGFQLFYEGNSDCIMTFARVCEIKKTLQTFPYSPWIDIPTGVWIDVFPLDVAPDCKAEVEIQIRDLKKGMRKLYLCRQAMAKFSYNMPLVWNLKLLIKKFLLKTIWDNPHKFVVNYIKECRKFEGIKSHHLCNFAYTGFGIKEYQLTEDYANVFMIQFEKYSFMCVKGYDRIMHTKYGDYMQIPSKEEQRIHPINSYWR